MDNIRFEYENFFEYGGFKTAYLIHLRKQLKLPEEEFFFDLSKAKRIQEEYGGANCGETMEDRAAAEEQELYQEVHELMDAMFELIENDLILNRYRNKTGDINTRRIGWPRIIRGYYGEEQTLQESGAANNRTKNNIMEKLLDLIERNPHKERYDFHISGIKTIRRISMLQAEAATRERISDAVTAFTLFHTKSIGDLTERLEELSLRIEDMRNAATYEYETKICRISGEESKVYREEKRVNGEFKYMLLAGNEVIDKGEEPFFYVKNDIIRKRDIRIVPVISGKINRKIPAKIASDEYGGSRIYIDAPPVAGKYELLKGNVVIRRHDKPEFYLKDPPDGSVYYIRVVIDEAEIETMLHFANMFHVRSELTNLLSNTSTLTTIYKYYFLISRSIQIIEELNPKTYKKMEAYVKHKDTHKTEAFTTLSSLLIGF